MLRDADITFLRPLEFSQHEKNWFEQITRNINEHRKSVFATLPVLVMLWLQISAKRFLWDAVVDDKLVVQTIGTHLDVDSLKATKNKSLIASHRCESIYLLEDSWIPILKTYNCQMLEESRGSMGQNTQQCNKTACFIWKRRTSLFKLKSNVLSVFL